MSYEPISAYMKDPGERYPSKRNGRPWGRPFRPLHFARR
jgi:hypothetical protein